MTQPTAQSTTLSCPTHPIVVAHRGLSGVCPENTLPAFTAAVALGADELELDLCERRARELAAARGLRRDVYIAGEKDVLECARRLAPDVPRCCLEGFEHGACIAPGRGAVLQRRRRW